MNFCVLGAGAWGTAFALHLSRLGHTVTLVPRRSDQAIALASERENKDYLPGYRFDDSLQIAGEVGPAIMEAEVIVLACPVKGVKDFCFQIKDNLRYARRIRLFITLCKGLDRETLMWPISIVKKTLPSYVYGVLSGPTNAAEVAAGKPTAMVFASESKDAFIADVQKAISNESMRVYASSDVVGVEFCGCVKNIYAIGAGIADGLRLGDNAKAAYMTRALNEMAKLGESLGGQLSTFNGLSGFGDLVATCSGAWSRNRSFGEALTKGASVKQYMSDAKTAIEGYWATQSINQLCTMKGIEAPILKQLYEVLYEGKKPQSAIIALMTRDLKAEGQATQPKNHG